MQARRRHIKRVFDYVWCLHRESLPRIFAMVLDSSPLGETPFECFKCMQHSHDNFGANAPHGCQHLLREQFSVLSALVAGSGRNAFLTLSAEARREIESLYLKVANGLVARTCDEVRDKSICASISDCPSAGGDGAMLPVAP